MDFPVLNKEATILCKSDYLRITGLDEGSLIEVTGFSCAKEILNYYGPYFSFERTIESSWLLFSCSIPMIVASLILHFPKYEIEVEK